MAQLIDFSALEPHPWAERSVAVPCCHYDDDYNFSTLGASNLRMVERLRVWHGSVRNVATFHPGTLPMLRELEGPAQLARQLLVSSPVERLTLSFDQDNALDEILSGTPPAQNVLVLSLSISGDDIACLDPVLKLFPNLSKLTAWINLYETANHALHSQIWQTARQIAGMGPISLVSLSLTFYAEVEREEDSDESSESDCSDDFEVCSTSDYTAFIAKARARCPDLKDVWIETEFRGEFFAGHWRQHLNGRVSQETR
ncbi:hypothetical protein C8F01DRAFT_1262722 [Mycena amicta]|nr:hypothetical protein C8F01DRAFT_1262722 [Mycena amicta]